MSTTGKAVADNITEAKEFLDSVSPSMCLAKWFHVSLHLTTGQTHSCYHPPTHAIDIAAIKKNPSALHNTEQKKNERQMMLDGKRPQGCSYCWMIEDAPNPPPGGHTSDRHFRSSESWAVPLRDLPLKYGSRHDFDPSYVEVNFNQACNFKCSYCSPHLSTAWQKEIEAFGPYQTVPAHNDISSIVMPSRVSAKDNAYVQAFWEWWPKLYPGLRVFRMTGGEPLMDKNTFKVLDYVSKHPNKNLVIGVTSNMCPPEPSLMDKFVGHLKEIENYKGEDGQTGAIHYFSLYVSVDAYGKRGDYIRNGLDFNVLDANVRRVLRDTRATTLNLINTFNVMSVTSLREYLEWVLDIRRYISGLEADGLDPSYWNYQRFYFDTPMLRYPTWQSIQTLPESYQRYLVEGIEYMEANRSDVVGDLVGFYEYEIERMRRNLRWMQEGTDGLEMKQANFYRFFSEHDRRRGTSFIETYPEMEDWWNMCRAAAGE